MRDSSSRTKRPSDSTGESDWRMTQETRTLSRIALLFTWTILLFFLLAFAIESFWLYIIACVMISVYVDALYGLVTELFSPSS